MYDERDSYYDLVSVVVDGKRNNIPAPIFEELTGIDAYKLPYVEKISKEYFFEQQMIEKLRKETIEFLNQEHEEEVRAVIERLVNGEILLLKEVRNQYGRMIPSEQFYMNEEGLFEVFRITCLSSGDFGLGNCRCVNHYPSETYLVEPDIAVQYIKNYIKKQKEIEQEKIHNQEFLRKLCSDRGRVGQIARELMNGNSIVLDEVTTQYGRVIPCKTLYYSDGEFWLWEIKCFSSDIFGLGECQCNSHVASIERKITIKQFVDIVFNI